MDMSPAHISAVLNHLPEATIVFDHFHVTKLFNDKLSDLRRDLYRETKENLRKEVLKGTRWLLLGQKSSIHRYQDAQKACQYLGRVQVRNPCLL